MSVAARFAGRVALVTGAARGIGRATAEQFARNGGRVALVDRIDEEVEAAADVIRQAGADALAVTADVSDSAAVSRAVAACGDRWGRIDVLVNNAGIHFARGIDEYTDEEIDRILSLGPHRPSLRAWGQRRRGLPRPIPKLQQRFVYGLAESGLRL